jgi:hypothetical protein
MADEPRITVDFTIQEVTVLQQLLHIAVQARGLEVAEAALHINRKLQIAAGTVRPDQTARQSNGGSVGARD